MARYNTHSIEFKRQVAQHCLAGRALHSLVRWHGLSRNLNRIWKHKLEGGDFGDQPVAAGTIEAYEEGVVALERLVGRQALEIEFLSGAEAGQVASNECTVSSVWTRFQKCPMVHRHSLPQ